MKYLGLDLGTRTLGLSISDGIIANSLKTIRYEQEEELLTELEKVIVDNKVNCLVLGFPKNMNNTIGPRAEETLNFKTRIENKFNLPVFLQDERLSTVSAHNYMIEANLSRKREKQKLIV